MSRENKRSVCVMDCPDTCSLTVELQDGRVERIGPSELHPTTQGFICTKIARFAGRLYSQERVLFPMRRLGEKGSGRFERLSWDEAVATICQRFREIVREWGGEAILPYSYGGSNGLLAQDTTDRAFFARLGASRLARTLCAAPTTAVAEAMYGLMPSTAFEDFQHARFILIWGANPKVSNIHLVPYLRRAKAAGAKIAVVDPRRNFSENEIDLHLPVYPGTDLAVALALVHWWHERNWINWDFLCRHARGAETLLRAAAGFPPEKAARIARVPAEAIVRLAEGYALHDPAVVRVGWGLERNRNGGPAVAAVLALPALLGKFGRPGSGYALSTSGAYQVDEARLTEAPPWHTRVINMSRLGHVLLHENAPPIKALFVYNCNPAVTAPNQQAVLRGLQREDLFTVVFEQVMTDTARLADIVLPAPTFLEQTELKKAYGGYALQYLEPVVAPAGEAKANDEVFALLGRAMGWDDPVFTESREARLRRILAAIRGLGRELRLSELQRERIALFDFPGRAPVQFKTVFPRTADGKVDLAPAVLGPTPYALQVPGEERFPLALISPATDKMISSTLGEFNFPELYVALHPADAEARHLKAGQVVRVYNALGEVHATLRLDERVRAGVAVMPKGAWRKASKNGLTATALAPDHVSSVGGGACFNDARVEVEAVR